MVRIAISVEGQTEEAFCKEVLSLHFRRFNIELIPIVISTKRIKCGIKYKGGCINLDRVKNELRKILPNFDYVTTFYDLYGFSVEGNPSSEELEKTIYAIFNDKKLIPYIQQYEFETLLFSNSSYYEEYFQNLNAKSDVDAMIQSCGGIENINNSRETAPSKRIVQLFETYNERYDKVFHGSSIADDIGLGIIMEKCDRFNTWIQKIKKLGEV